MCLGCHALALLLPSLHIPRQVLLQTGGGGQRQEGRASLRRSCVVRVTNSHVPTRARLTIAMNSHPLKSASAWQAPILTGLNQGRGLSLSLNCLPLPLE